MTKLLSDINILGYEKIKVILDRGFYSAANIRDLYKHYIKFLIAAKISLKLVQTHFDKVRDTMRNWAHYNQTYQLLKGTKVIAKEEALAEAKRNYGYFTLLSNEVKDPVNALEIYRNKDLVEKGFNNLKERLNSRRMAVSSEHSLNGKLFVQFIALIYLSYITRKMQQTKLFKNHLCIIRTFDADLISYHPRQF